MVEISSQKMIEEMEKMLGSKEGVAHTLGVSVGTINNWKGGKKIVKNNQRILIASYNSVKSRYERQIKK